ncbi:MAG: class I SAM-dependent methyltransferase [Oscillatoriales cyanobacterium SM2_1_8]|nr:class I SAM-dependent methyltransferase [Oscillatoriales cyanobacterium SM2_1_8]
MLLTPEQRTKLDETNDTLFYQQPRFVTHVDDGFLAQLTALYRDLLPTGGRILDLMSSWVSHLPPEVEYSWVEGHGMNAAELAQNPRLHHFFVQNLNAEPHLPLSDNDFDAVVNTVSVQYLQRPEIVFAEIQRVLKPGGVAIVSFSNRMFYQKAVQVWRDGSDASHVELVKGYFRFVPGFTEPEALVRQGHRVGWWESLLGQAQGCDPFFAVMARKA